MPSRPLRLCNHVGCGALTKDGYCPKHPRKAWATNEGKSRQERGYGAAWQRIRKAVLIRDNYLCAVCMDSGRLTPAQEVDHIKPKAAGGTNNMDNLRAICTRCHRAKSPQDGRRYV